MEYTKGRWIVGNRRIIATGISRSENGNKVFSIDGFHSPEEDQGNLELATAAVNGCLMLNAVNPLAVAQSIFHLYEAVLLSQDTLKMALSNCSFGVMSRIEKRIQENGDIIKQIQAERQPYT